MVLSNQNFYFFEFLTFVAEVNIADDLDDEPEPL